MKHKTTNKFKWAILLVIIILIIDQTLKIWVKTHMLIGESSYTHWDWKIKWAQLLFVENNGMAFGIEWPGNWGKFLLTSFRIIIISFIGYYIYKLSKKEVPLLFVLVMATIFAGAAGNLFDSLFYGMIFDNSHSIYDVVQNPELTTTITQETINPAKFSKIGHGYGKFMHGKVVDMFYFPIINTNIPNFVPIWGGKNFQFFKPIFNVADSFITIGVILLLIFGKKWFNIVQKIEKQ